MFKYVQTPNLQRRRQKFGMLSVPTSLSRNHVRHPFGSSDNDVLPYLEELNVISYLPATSMGHDIHVHIVAQRIC